MKAEEEKLKQEIEKEYQLTSNSPSNKLSSPYRKQNDTYEKINQQIEIEKALIQKTTNQKFEQFGAEYMVMDDNIIDINVAGDH